MKRALISLSIAIALAAGRSAGLGASRHQQADSAVKPIRIALLVDTSTGTPQPSITCGRV